MLFDTHCHLNFQAFEGRVEEIIASAQNVGVNYFVVPGTDIETSQKAITIAKSFSHVYAAVGIHPHHLFKIQNLNLKSLREMPQTSTKQAGQNDNLKLKISKILKEVEYLLSFKKVVAVGEIGLDRYVYQKTQYLNYQITEEFIKVQKLFFIEQLKLARKYQKAAIVHNRLATEDLLNTFSYVRDLLSNIRMVFHCCQADDELLDLAKKHQIFIGVDGDVTYDQRKQEFVKKVPLAFLVLETDSPFLTPTTLLPQKLVKNLLVKRFPNQPKNLPFIAEFVAQLKKISVKKLTEVTTENALKLFRLL